jgi:uncharacterized membrane protein
MPTPHASIPHQERRSERRKKDPYEAYYRHERRQHRLQIAIVVGAFFLTVSLILGAMVFWHLATQDEVASVGAHSTASN